ncbi:protocadherin-7-like [Limulus polyphemus]|uniref:Protocadherin-7-like n=1 Tax=Limulus polyphemus TaxID=6850 RepID=A0ABM1C2P0_LIMPO|nr:protocadherin-7-like [Limulus polyphemus]
MAKDPDVDTVLTFSIIRGNDEQKFVIDSRNGQVLTADVLDYEQRQSYDLLVQVSDGVNTAATPLSVKVVDINDRQPVFTHNYYNFSVVEEIRQNITIGSVLAIDSDSGKNAAVRYSILGSRASKVFRIDQRGNIFTQRSLDRETETKLEFLVVAFDGGLPQLSGTSTVMVYVEDINDNPPTFESDNYVVNVPEEREPPYKVFEIIAEDKDSGENAEMKYNIIGGNENNAFEIDEDSGIVYTADKLNYEDQSEHKLEIVARNTKPFQGPTAVNLANPVVQLIVRVQDINDGAVVFSQPSYQYGILENTPRAESIGFVNATNFGRSPQDQDITYWIGEGNDNDLFWVNPNTGMVILMDTLDADPPANQRLFNLKVCVS